MHGASSATVFASALAAVHQFEPGYHRRLSVSTPPQGPAIPGPPVLGGPLSDPGPIDPHAAVGGLIEAFEEVLDLGIPKRLRRVIDAIILARWKWATAPATASRR